MTEDERRYLQLIHRTASDLEELRRRGSIPPEVVQQAASMSVIHIGEAANQVEHRHPELSAELATRLPEVNWKGWIAFRNVLAHNLFDIDPRAIDDAAVNHAPLLRRGLEREFGPELATPPSPARGPEAQRHHGPRPEPQRAAEVQDRQPSPERDHRAEPASAQQPYDPDLLDFCYRRRGLQPGEVPTEQDILVYNWIRAPKRVNTRLAAARSLGRERRAILWREPGSGAS